MFGFLKKLGRKSESALATAPIPVPAAAAIAPAPVRAARPMNGASRLTTPVSRPAAVHRPAPVPAAAPEAPVQTAVPAVPVPVPAAKPPPTVIVELSLKKLWTRLSPDVVRLAHGHPDADSMLRFPLPLLQAQLAKGAIKLPLVQLRQYSPAGLFPANPEKDTTEVEIPIAEVIPLIKPEYFARRPNQRKVEVPDDIGVIFGPGAGPVNGLRVAEQKPRATPGTAPGHAPARNGSAGPDLSGIPDLFKKIAPEPSPVLPVAEEAAPIPAPKLSLPSAPAPTAPAAKSQPKPLPKLAGAAPAQAAAGLKPPAPAPALPTTTAPASTPAIPISPIAPASPASAPATPSSSTPIPAPKLDPSLASLKVPAAKAPARKSSAAKTLEGEFTIALMDVAAYWSEKGRNDLQNLYRHTLEIPMSTLDKALKAGKLLFQWREVRPWLRLAPGNGMPALADDLEIELPLAIVAPRFLEARGVVRPKTEMDLGDIPDVFEQKVRPPSADAGPATPPLGATAVPYENAAALAPSNAASKTGDTAFLARTAGKALLEFGEIFGQPDKKNWTLSEVAQKTLGLRGVAGAIIATSDGLLMAGNWPGGPKNDAVAAFVPQMYNKILQYSKELKIGEPSSFMLMIENVPLQIFKTGDTYFTVIGRPGENLPKAQLNAVATRLGTTHK